MSKSVLIFGDSIGRGSFLTNPTTEGWAWRLGPSLAPQGISVENLSVGGMTLHDAGPSKGNVFLPHIKAEMEARPVPDAVVLCVGTNDVITHDIGLAAGDIRNLGYSRYALIDVVTYLRGKGVKSILLNAIYPFCPGSNVPEAWVAPLNARADDFNAWAFAQFPDLYFDVRHVLLDRYKQTRGQVTQFADGIHPNAVGHDRLFRAFPVGRL